MKFSLKPKQRTIRVVSAPGVKWAVVPMTTTEETELARGYQEYDARTKTYQLKDFPGFLKAKARQVIRGWSGLPGDDGKDIPYSTAALEAMCEMHSGVITEVLAESGRADAIEAEADEKNS